MRSLVRITPDPPLFLRRLGTNRSGGGWNEQTHQTQLGKWEAAENKARASGLGPQQERGKYDLKETARYLHLSQRHLHATASPLDSLVLKGRSLPEGFSLQAPPVCAEFVEQEGAEHHVTVLSPFAALDVNHHPFAIDVADLQAC